MSLEINRKVFWDASAWPWRSPLRPTPRAISSAAIHLALSRVLSHGEFHLGGNTNAQEMWNGSRPFLGQQGARLWGER